MTIRSASDWLRARTGRLQSDQRGAAALEFALIVPMIVIALLTTIDLGMALNEKMEMDRSLRAGAEGLLAGSYRDDADPETKVKQLVEAIATGEVQDPNAEINMSTGDLQVTVNNFCACPSSVGTEVDCDGATCASGDDPFEFYRISADTQFQAIFIPNVPLSGTVLVQVE